MPSLDLDTIRHALEVARRHGFAEVELELGESKFSAKLEKVKAKPPQAHDTAAPQSDGTVEIHAPLVGYYREAKIALEPGTVVERGEVVAIITALGLANEVEAPQAGEVVEVLVKNGDPVEYGQTLARVKVGI